VPTVASFAYHDVTDEPHESGVQSPGASAYTLGRAAFRRHLDAFAGVSLRPELVTALDLTAPGRHLVLTFDDGGKSALEVGDELARRGWRGHFFIITGRIGERTFLDAAGIRSLRRSGHIIGSHSRTHPHIFREQTLDPSGARAAIASPICWASPAPSRRFPAVTSPRWCSSPPQSPGSTICSRPSPHPFPSGSAAAGCWDDSARRSPLPPPRCASSRAFAAGDGHDSSGALRNLSASCSPDRTGSTCAARPVSCPREPSRPAGERQLLIDVPSGKAARRGRRHCGRSRPCPR